MLRPVRRSVPRCEAYDDHDKVMEYERAMRVHRAHTEPHLVEAIEGADDASFRVVSESERAYHVDLVDGTHDTCDCPDWLANELATCKHLEAVRRVLAMRPAWQRGVDRLMGRRRAPTIGVDGRVGDLIAIGSIGERALSACGCTAPRSARRIVPRWSRDVVVAAGRVLIARHAARSSGSIASVPRAGSAPSWVLQAA